MPLNVTTLHYFLGNNSRLDPWGFYDFELVGEFCALAGPPEDEEHARYSLAVVLSVGPTAA